jgi:hypothetical protein
VNEQQVTEQTAQPPELTPQDRALLSGIAAGRARHTDFDEMLPIMDVVVKAPYSTVQYPPDWKSISAKELLESLYVIPKHANFTAEARRRAVAQALQPPRVM